MMNRLILFSAMMLFSIAAVSQTCGTSQQAQIEMAEQVKNTRDQWMKYMDVPEAPIYIPVKFHRVGKRDGSGKVGVIDIMEQLCRLNRDYEDREMNFYLKGGVEGGILDIFNDDIYENPSSSSAVNILGSVSDKNRDAINIYVTLNATSGSGGEGVTLGFYRPQGDYVVMKKSEVERATASLSHEMGHFFGLPHTFLGWETQEYDCNSPTPNFVAGFLVEHVDRNKMRGGSRACLQAADGFCGTQADYNLGFGFTGGCNYVGCAKDPDGASLDPDENNMMGYFLSCLEEFSDDQYAFMLSNFNSRARDYIRSTFIPNLAEVPNEEIQLIQPPRNGTSQYFNSVTFEWESVDNATHYILEVEEFGSSDGPLIIEFVQSTSFTATNLEAGKRYNWRVYPVGELDVCNDGSSTWRFTTSRTPVSVIDHQLLQAISLSSNPVAQGQHFTCFYDGPYSGEMNLELMGVNGKILFEDHRPTSGQSVVQLPSLPLKGIYLLKVSVNDKMAVKKIVVQ